MEIADFFALNPVFRTEQFGDFLNKLGRTNIRTRDAHLRRYTLAGRLLRIKRGYYAVVPRGHQASNYQVDPYLVAGRLVDDAVIAYHAAIQYHGHAYSLWNTYPILLPNKTPDLRFQGYKVRWAAVPASLARKQHLNLEVKTHDREGLPIKVTTLERTLVDCLDRPDLGGDWEEVHHSFGGVSYLNLAHLIDYVAKLEKAVSAARAGYFLEQNRQRWKVDDEHLNALRKLSPKLPTYLNLKAKGRSTTVKGWNLIVPTAIQEKHWEEPQA